MFDPTKVQPWDIYSCKVKPGFKASNAPIDRDVLHARSMGIADWTEGDTKVCDRFAQIGRDAANIAAGEQLKKEGFFNCDCHGQGCGKCDAHGDNAKFYRPKGGRTGRVGVTESAILDADAVVSDNGRYLIIVPTSKRGREWFTVNYASRQNAVGAFIFGYEAVLPLADAINAAGLITRKA